MPRDRRQLLTWLLWLIPAGCLACLLWPSLTGSGFAFRDTGHFYHPGFSWQADTFASGELPFWNDQQGLGSDEVGDGSSSLFYPIKLVYCLPITRLAALNLYILIHFILAFLFTVRLARHWQTGRSGSLLASFSYVLGGAVLSLHANPIFLVGAAWLPAGIHQLDHIVLKQRFRAAIPLSIILGMMILGGDPQAALLLMLAGFLLWILPRPEANERVRSSLALTLAAVLASGLAAVQLLPTLQSAKESTRQGGNTPASIYQLPKYSPDEAFDGLLRRPAEGGAGDLYEFSLPPWRLAELCWPNVSGRLYPANHRWLRAAGGEGRIWTPSLYMGLAVFVLAVGNFHLRRSETHLRWCSWLALLTALGSLGSYALGWLLRQTGILAQTAAMDPVGGLYWLLVTLVPGFSQFRYPAKLWVLGTLAMAILAGRGLDRAGTSDRRPLVKRLAAVTAISLLLLVSAWLLRSLIVGWLTPLRADTLLGPLQASAAWADISNGLLHATILCLLLWLAVVNLPLRQIGPVVLALTVTELSLANQWMLARAPASHWNATSPLAPLARKEEGASGMPHRFFRAGRRGWQPQEWVHTSSADRLAEAIRWDRQTLVGRHQLLTSLASLESRQSIQPRLLEAVLRAARRHGSTRTDGKREPDSALLRLLGVRWLLGPTGWNPGGPSHPVRPLAEDNGPANLEIWKIRDPLPFCWIASHALQVGEVSSRPADLARQLETDLYPQGQLRDLARSVLLHRRQEELPPRVQPSVMNTERGSAEVVHYSTNQRQLKVQLAQPGWLVVSQAFHPGWRVWTQTGDGDCWIRRPAERANYLMTAIHLPSGRHLVRMEFGHSILWPGGVITLVTLMLILLTMVAQSRCAPAGSGQDNRQWQHG